MRATRALLVTHRFADLSVAKILHASGTAKGSFYFYFASKEDLLAALVDDAVGSALGAASNWTESRGETDPVSALRAGTVAGARLWQANAPVLRAIVEAAGTNADLDAQWRAQMARFTQSALDRIDRDERAQAWLAGRDPVPVVTALTWLGERVYYLAATDTPPFTDQDTVVETLTDAWSLALYGAREPVARR